MSESTQTVDKIIDEHIKTTNVPEEYRDETSDLMRKMMTHEAYGNPDYKWSLDDFEIGKRLGRGSFGRVFLAREKKTGFIIALKTMIKREVVEAQVEQQVLREIEIQSHLKHPNILQLLCWFQDDFRIYLALEYAGKGEIYGHLKNSPNGRFDEHRSAKYIYQVADALQYCHENSVIHRDIKPENLLLTITDDVKLADFGWSVHAPSLRRTTVCGTLHYFPPEMVDSKEYNHYVDNWCLGILGYEFLVGRTPFECKSEEQTFKKIRSLQIQFPSFITPEARDLISKLVVLEPKNRLSLKEVMIHSWITRNK